MSKKKETVDRVVIDYENRSYLYEVEDVALGSGCSGCGFSCDSGIVVAKVIACDRYGCTPVCRGDGRNVIFKRVRRGEK